ncbi:hypothetical protein MZM54_01715 [[Brevibacterium] frigoritolerans]|nr:hypothetical protein [Peribacillus frigoritolerans]
MGEVIFHLDREPIDDKIRVDYKWEKNGIKYYITNIPCIDFPFEAIPKKSEYMTTEVSDALSMLIYMQENDEEIPKIIDFTKIEGLLKNND